MFYDFISPAVLLASNNELGVILLVFLLITFLLSTFYNEYRKQQNKHLWKGFAKSLKGSYHPELTPIGEIKTRIQGVQIIIDTKEDPAKGSLRITTRVSTSVHSAKGFTLSLSPEGFVASISKAFGRQDIVLGDQVFDHKFIVKSNNELLCRLWLNAMIRPMLLLLEDYTLSIQEGTILLSKVGIERDLSQLTHAVEVCAKLAKHLPKLSENWLALARRFEARLKNVKGQNPLPHNTSLEFEYHGCRYNIEVISTSHTGVLTKLSAEKPSAIGLFSIVPFHRAAPEGEASELTLPLMPKRYRVFANNKEDATYTISESVIQAIQKITPYSISSTQQNLEILLPGFVYAPEIIKTALDLATTFVSQSQSAYR
jgi:hypothetical protein